MAFVLSSISGNLISAASAGFAPTNSADVSAIASAYQVVSATATQLYAGTSYVTSVNDAPLSASRAGNAANASLASSAWYDGTGRLISALPDSAAVSAIASAYAESAASGKQDELTFSYDDDKISAINGSALAGQGGGGGGIDSATCSAIASAYAESAASSKLDTTAYNSADFYSTSNPSGFVDSAYVESSVSGKQDTLTFAYDDDKISAINGSALAGQGGGGGGGSVVSPFGTIAVTDGSSIEATNSATGVTGGYDQVLHSVWPSNHTLYMYSTYDIYGTSSLGTGVDKITLQGEPNTDYPDSEFEVSLDLYGGEEGWDSLGNSVATAYGSSMLFEFTSDSAWDISRVAAAVYNAPTDVVISGWYQSASSLSFLQSVPSGTAVRELDWKTNYGYDGANQISSINGSAIGGTVTSLAGGNSSISAVNGSGLITRPSAVCYNGSSAISLVWSSNVGLSLSPNTTGSSRVIVGNSAVGVYKTANVFQFKPTSLIYYNVTAERIDGTTKSIGYGTAAINSSDVPFSSVILFGTNYRTTYQTDSVRASSMLYTPSGDVLYKIPLENDVVLKSADPVVIGQSNLTIATAHHLVAIGMNNSAYAYSQVIGHGNYVTGGGAIGTGNSARSNGYAIGRDLSAAFGATVVGINNKSANGNNSTGAAFVIGDGTASNARHDLMVVTKDGEITMYSGTADTTGTGIMSSIRAISAAATGGGGVDSATVSAIASSYAESAVSSYQPLSGMSGYASAFSAGEGLEFVQSGSDQVLQVEAPVDIVAGPGIVIDNPDGNTLRISVAQADETVLFYDSNGQSTGTFSEPISNFERIKVLYVWNSSTDNKAKYAELQGVAQVFSYLDNGKAGTTYNWFGWGSWEITTTGFSLLNGYQSIGNLASTSPVSSGPKIYKVIGIHRIANN